MFMVITCDNEYELLLMERRVRGKLNSIIVEVCVSGILTLMIAAEIILLNLSAFTSANGAVRLKRGAVLKTCDETVQALGIVRGLTFFFAMFQYMAIAFTPVVMLYIYKPTFDIPLVIMTTIPITVQIFMAILFSWVCGGFSEKRGWRTAAILGMLLMVAGAFIAAMAMEPVLFIISQAVLGSGIGLAKTAFDIFGVLAPESGRLEEYSASTNAGLIVGMSCSAAIGAVVADVLGFSGAFLSMGCFGLFVIGLVVLLSDNIIQAGQESPPDTGATTKTKFTFDLKYAAYIAFLILPYAFISMYVDYFFPVYADSNGMSTTDVGYAFLMYGILTSYVGAFLCKRLSKRIHTVIFAASILALLGIHLSLFAMIEGLVYATAFMLMIAVADGIMPSLQYRYVYTLDLTKRIGLSRVIGMEGAFSNAIRGVAPMIFGAAMLFGVTGLLVAGALVFTMAVLFLLSNRGEDIMKKALIFLAVCFALCFSPGAAVIDVADAVNTVVRVGYCEGESYYEFNEALNNLIYGLEEYGLIGTLPDGMPVHGSSREIWSWISSLVQMDWNVKFVKDAYFSLTDGQYADIFPPEALARIIQTINGQQIDLMLAMGTTASLKIKNLDCKASVMCFATADAVKSGIVEDAILSNTPGVWAQTDTDAFKRSIYVMNDIFMPKKLGVVYENTADAYIYSGIDVLKDFCDENGIELLHVYVDDPKTENDYPAYIMNLSRAYEKLSKEADVFILTTSLVEMDDFDSLFEPFYRERTPVYSINSTEEVRFGALMASESSDYRNIGRFGADTISRFLNGEKLENLPQVYQTAPFLVINYQTARKIGYRPSFRVLLSASQIYGF